MKIAIKNENGKKINIRIPLFKSMAGIGAKIIFSQNNDEDIGLTKAEQRDITAKAIEILKEHKGLVLVDIECDDDAGVKITI